MGELVVVGLWFGLLIGGGGIVHRLARERGRSGAAWAAAHVTVVLSTVLAGLLLPVALFGASIEVALAGAAVALVLPVLGAAGVLVLVWIQPPVPAQMRGTRFAVYRMSEGKRPGHDGSLGIEDAGLWLEGEGSQRIEWPSLEAVEADHECVRLRWCEERDGPATALLVPGGETPAIRARAAEGLAERIRRSWRR